MNTKLSLTGLLIVLLSGTAFFTGSWWGARQMNTHWMLKWQQRDASDAVALAQRQAAVRTEEQRRQGEIDEIRKQASQQFAGIQRDADRARAAYHRLHNKADNLARQLAARERACRAGTSGTGQTETGSAVLLADLFRRADERAGELAREADEARVRGLACEAAYDAIAAPSQR